MGLSLGTDGINSWIFLKLEVLLNFNIVYLYWFVLGVLPQPILGQMFLRLKWRVSVLLSFEGRFIGAKPEEINGKWKFLKYGKMVDISAKHLKMILYLFNSLFFLKI